MPTLNTIKVTTLMKMCDIPSISALSRESGLPRETLSRIWHGRKPDLDTLEKLADTFNPKLYAQRLETIQVGDLISS